MSASIRPILAAILLAFPALLGAETLRASRPQGTERSASLAGGQAVALTDELVPGLLAAPFDRPVPVSDWPLAPGVFRDVLLFRRQVYAPEARIYRIGPEGMTEVPRSRLAFFAGGSTDGQAGLWLSIDPETGELAGSAQILGELYALRRTGGRYAVAAARAFGPAGEVPPAFACGIGKRPLAGTSLPNPSPGLPFPAKALASLHTATVAVDTDNELMLIKFGNDTASAANYLGQLFTGLNAMFERDLSVRLLQGTTFLRISTVPDPYSQPPDAITGATTEAQLDELAAYWSAHNGDVPRALTMMLSGKSRSNTGSAGIAHLDGLCDPALGYSFTQVIRSASFDASFDVRLVGHELGHNFGSDHTHCYDPPIDTCFNGEAARGCYNGAESCPAAATVNGVPEVQGTVMSYCNLRPSGCTAAAVFHPRTLDVIDPILTSRLGICVFPAVAPARLHTVSPCRLIDTRNPAGPLGGPALAAAASRSFPVTGACGIPADAQAIAGNVTVVSPAADGFLNAYATGSPTPTSLINFRAGQIKANNAILKLPTTGGSLTFQNGSGGTVSFLLDVTGYLQ